MSLTSTLWMSWFAGHSEFGRSVIPPAKSRLQLYQLADRIPQTRQPHVNKEAEQAYCPDRNPHKQTLMCLVRYTDSGV
jgi:hypothetical protein